MRGKTRQSAENKQTFDLIDRLTGKIEIDGKWKSRQNGENKQNFDLTEFYPFYSLSLWLFLLCSTSAVFQNSIQILMILIIRKIFLRMVA